MKLLCILLSVILATSYSMASTASPKAYEKLKTMFESAKTPANLNDLYLDIEKIKGCASTTANKPDQIDNGPYLAVVNYETEDFGPSFPSKKFTGIALKEKSDTHVSARSVFNTYRSYIDKSGLHITGSTYSYEKIDCDDVINSMNECSHTTETNEVSFSIKVSGNTIHFIQDDLIAYCWK